jgi:hypothetical protein
MLMHRYHMPISQDTFMKNTSVTKWLLCALGLWLLGQLSANCFYDPGLQRWVTRDPTGEPGVRNLYQFVNNIPVHNMDPFGDSPIAAAGAAIGTMIEPGGGTAVGFAVGALISAIAGVCVADAIIKSKEEKCDQEWADAREWCRNELAKPPYQRNKSGTGGYDTVDNCARGKVSQECGGNPVAPKPPARRRPPFYGK